MRNHPISGKGKPHEGIDIAAPKGTSVKSMGAGTVQKAGWQDLKDHSKGYGQEVVVTDGKGHETRYGHLDAVSVKDGQNIKAGEEIGKVGSTGASTGNHLHYEERYHGVPHEPTFDPNNYEPSK